MAVNVRLLSAFSSLGSHILKSARYVPGYSVKKVSPEWTACTVQYRSLSLDPAKWPESDLEKVSKAFSRCRIKRLIKAAARENGPFPEYNPRLSQIIEEAKKWDISPDSIDYNIRVTLDIRSKTGLYEIFYPGGALVIAQYDSVDVSNVEHRLITIAGEYDATFMGGSTQNHNFYDLKAAVVVSSRNGQPLNTEDVKELQEAHADCVHERIDHSGKKLVTIYSDPLCLHDTKRGVEAKGYDVEEAHVEHVPKTMAKVPDNALPKLADMLLEISNLPEIERIYENVL